MINLLILHYINVLHFVMYCYLMLRYLMLHHFNIAPIDNALFEGYLRYKTILCYKAALDV